MATGHQSGKKHGLKCFIREIVEGQPTQLLQHRRHVTRLQNHLKFINDYRPINRIETSETFQKVCELSSMDG